MALPLLALEEGNNGTSHGMLSHCTYTGFDFITFAKNIKLSERLAKKLIADLVAKEEAILAIYESSFMPSDDIEAVKTWIKSRSYYLTQQQKINI